MPTLPSGLPYGTVIGRFLFVSQDKADVDTNPDYTLVTGSIKFTCSAVPLKVLSQNLTVIPLVFEAGFDSEGNLVPVGDTSLTQGLKLPATDSTIYNPSGFVWRVDFRISDAATGEGIRIPSFNIAVPEGTTVDLANVIPIAGTQGSPITTGPPGTPYDGPAITISASAPVSPENGDIWFDIS
jgi:hypothetical protein